MRTTIMTPRFGALCSIGSLIPFEVPVLPALAVLLAVGSVPFAASGQTVTWVGGNTNGAWMTLGNWSPATAPLNDATHSFTVVVPDSMSLRYDAPAGGKIEALSFGAGSTLVLTNGQPLEVTGVAIVKGTLNAAGSGSVFKAPANTIVLQANPRLYAAGGAGIELGGSTYSWDRYNSSATLVSALGTGSKVDLRQLSSLSVAYGDNGGWTYAITAKTNGVIDLSSLANLTGPGSDDVLEVNADTGGQVLLSSVRQIGNNVRFNLGVPQFELPEALTIDATTVNMKTGVVLSLPKLTTLTGSSINSDSNSTISAPLVGSISGTDITVGRGTQFQAPQLASMDRVPLTLNGDASFAAPNLLTYRNSAIPVSPTRNFQSGILTNVYGSWITVTGGSTITIAAPDYVQPGWPGSYQYPPKRIFSASGTGSRLNAPTVKTLRVTGVDHGWDAEANTWRYEHSFDVVGENQGVVDLSGLIECYGGETGSYGNNDWLTFKVNSSGNVLLPSLKRALRHTAFDIDAQYDLPALEMIQLGSFKLANGAKVNLASLTNFDNTSISFGFNSAFAAPQLRTYLNSDLVLAPGRIFSTPPFTNFNASRISVSSGSSLAVAAKSYETIPDWQWSPTLFSADGTGSDLDFASIDTIRVYGGWNGARTYTLVANNNGTIDLSGLDVATGPDWGSYDNDDWLVFSVQNGGKIRLDTLREINGRVRISVGAGQRQDLPALAKIANGVSFDLAAGSTLVATQLTDVANCVINLGSAADLQLSVITNVYNSQIAVSGGRTLTVNAEYYESPALPGSYQAPPRAPFSVEDAGSLLNAPAMKSMQIYGVDHGWDPIENRWRYDLIYSVFAKNAGVADFSGLQTVYGGTTGYGNNDTLEFAATTGGIIKLGDLSVYRRVRFSAANPDSALHFKGLYLRSPATLSAGAATIIRNTGNFFYDNTDTSSILTEFATMVMDGTKPQAFETGSADIGPSTTTWRNNFGHSQLVVGNATQSSVVRLVDTIDNGGRGTSGQPEALYLYGLSGQGLRLFPGSRLILNNLNCYAAVNSKMLDLRTLIPAGSNSVAFDGGFIANFGGPAITNLSPASAVTPPVASVDVSFNTPVQASSFTVGDVTITGPGGAIAATAVTPLDSFRWRISFAPQSASGVYSVKVGPAINEVVANLTGMDQDGDGVGGAATDVFTGSFLIDGTAPSAVRVIALQGGSYVGIMFDERVTESFATNTANYLVNGAAPSKAVLQTNGTMVVLSVPALVGDTFSIKIDNQQDLLGNQTSQTVTGTILGLSAVDIGSPGSNPRELGSTITFDGNAFQTIAGGSDYFWNSSDAGHFVYERRSGDFDIRVRVSRLDKTPSDNYSQAGLMWRESLAANSRHTYFFVTPMTGGNQYYGVIRSSTGSSGYEWTYSNPSARSGVPIPNAWVRLRREGNVFSGWRSTNGVDWIELGRQTNAFPSDGYVGMATSARNNNAGQATTAWYENFSDFSPSFASHPQSQTVSSGANVTFAAVARGVSPLSYQWLFNGQPVTGANTNFLTLNAVSTARVGDYQLVVTNAYGVGTSQVATLVVDGIGLGGFEADLSPAPNGNNSVTVADWVKVGRLVAGLDTPLNTSEFVRADCAPRSVLADLALGDGRLTVADWTQSGRYAASLDPITAAGGPTAIAGAPAYVPTAATKDVPDRSVSLGAAHAWIGSEVEVPVSLASQGNENALGLSLVFDSSRVKCLGAVLGKDSAGSILQFNDNDSANGVAGLVLSRPTGQVFPAGVVEVARVRFSVVGEPGTTPVSFADAPVTREIVDPAAQPLASAYVPGAIQAVMPPHFEQVQRLANGTVQLRLTGADGDVCEVQASSDLANWQSLSKVQLSSAGCQVSDPAAASQPSRFYRLIPAQ